jgi:hypothetical protein
MLLAGHLLVCQVPEMTFSPQLGRYVDLSGLGDRLLNNMLVELATAEVCVHMAYVESSILRHVLLAGHLLVWQLPDMTYSPQLGHYLAGGVHAPLRTPCINLCCSVLSCVHQQLCYVCLSVDVAASPARACEFN